MIVFVSYVCWGCATNKNSHLPFCLSTMKTAMDCAQYEFVFNVCVCVILARSWLVKCFCDQSIAMPISSKEGRKIITQQIFQIQFRFIFSQIPKPKAHALPKYYNKMQLHFYLFRCNVTAQATTCVRRIAYCVYNAQNTSIVYSQIVNCERNEMKSERMENNDNNNNNNKEGS